MNHFCLEQNFELFPYFHKNLYFFLNCSISISTKEAGNRQSPFIIRICFKSGFESMFQPHSALKLEASTEPNFPPSILQ